MNFFIVRQNYSLKWTEGLFISNDSRFCYTLEDTVRPKGVKIPGLTAIQAGRYELVVTFSQKFQRQMPLLLNVPEFSGIRMHGGNTAQDSEGCILVAYNHVSPGLIQGTAEKDITAMLLAHPDQKHWVELIDTFH